MRFFNIFMLALLLAIFCHQPSNAQGYTPPPQPPVNEAVDANGVDLTKGRLVEQAHSVTIGGAGDLGLSFTRRVIGKSGTFRDSVSGAVVIDGANRRIVNIGEMTENFTLVGGVFVSDEKAGSTLVQNSPSGDYTYTLADGTVAIFAYVADALNYAPRAQSVIKALTRPTGEILTYHYYGGIVCLSPPVDDRCPTGTLARLAAVTSNQGYQIKLIYGTNEWPQWVGVANIYMTLKTVIAFNWSVDGCAPDSEDCIFSRAWPTLDIGIDGTFKDVEGNITRYFYHYPSGNLVGVKRPGAASQNVTIQYGTDDRVSQVVKDGVTTNYTYSESGGILTVTITDASPGNRIVQTNLANMQIVSDKNEDGETRYYYYYPNKLLKKILFPRGNSVEYEYDARGNVTKQSIVAISTSGLSPLVTTAVYPSSDPANPDRCASSVAAPICNKPISVTDPRGKITKFQYVSAHGGIEKITFPAPDSSTTCPNGSAVMCPERRYAYRSDFYGKYKTETGTVLSFPTPVTRLTTIAMCQTTMGCERSIGEGGNSADESREVISYGTNNVLPVSIASGSGDGLLTATTSYGYDVYGNRTTVDGPLPGTADTTQTRYDLDRRVIGVIGPDPDGSAPLLKHRAQRFTYNADSQVTLAEIGTVNSQSDADWASFATLQQLTSTYDDATARKTRDVLSAPTTATGVQLVQYSYDVLGRLECQAMRMNSATWGSLPASACTLANLATPNPDRITRTVYDAVGRISTQQSAYGVTTANGFPATLQRTEATYTYTSNDKVQTLTDAKSNRTTYEYDGLDRLDKTRYPSPTTPNNSSTLDYEQPGYDANGNVTLLRMRDGTSLSFVYDNLNRLTFKNLPGAEPDVTFVYDLMGRQISASQPGHALSFTYDALGRNLTQVGPLGTVTSKWDIAGRRERLDLPGGFYSTYEYLLTNEVKEIKSLTTASALSSLATFTYDNLGNRTNISRANGTDAAYTPDAISRLQTLTQNLAGAASDQIIGLSYNRASQIATRASSNDSYAMRQQYNADRDYEVNGLNQYLQAGRATLDYDGRGNLKTQGNTSYVYDSQNQLTGVTLPTSTAVLGYDPLMRLAQATGSSTTRFLYDGTDLVAEYNSSGMLLRRYVHGPGIDEPLAWYEGSGYTDRRWLHADERGSVIAVSDISGNALGINAYDEYGNPQSGNMGRFGYSGQAWIAEAGAWYYKARFYNARLGRFLQPDPIGYLAGMNLYAYVANDPVNATDPMGLIEREAGWADITVTGFAGGGGFGNAFSAGIGPSGFTVFSSSYSFSSYTPATPSMLLPPKGLTGPRGLSDR